MAVCSEDVEDVEQVIGERCEPANQPRRARLTVHIGLKTLNQRPGWWHAVASFASREPVVKKHYVTKTAGENNVVVGGGR